MESESGNAFSMTRKMKQATLQKWVQFILYSASPSGIFLYIHQIFLRKHEQFITVIAASEGNDLQDFSWEFMEGFWWVYFIL